jgi:hypothetical protein
MAAPPLRSRSSRDAVLQLLDDEFLLGDHVDLRHARHECASFGYQTLRHAPGAAQGHSGAARAAIECPMGDNALISKGQIEIGNSPRLRARLAGGTVE